MGIVINGKSERERKSFNHRPSLIRGNRERIRVFTTKYTKEHERRVDGDNYLYKMKKDENDTKEEERGIMIKGKRKRDNV